MKKRKTNKEGWPVTPALVLLALAVAAYWNSFGVPYVFDDLASISLNSDVQFGASLTDWLWSPRGVLRATFALNRALNGDNVWGYHFVNLVLHILNAFLIYLLAHRIFRRHGSFSAPQIAALLAASIFLVHPVQTESVTYISSRSELLSTFFYTLAVLLFSRKAPDRIGFRFSLLIALFFFLGMRAKETVISLPAALLSWAVSSKLLVALEADGGRSRSRSRSSA